MLPLGYHFYKKALAKSFGEDVRLLYQDFNAPGTHPGAAALAARIRAAGLSLPVVAVGEEVVAAGRLPAVEELLSEVKARRKEN
uniref:Thioredoxin-like fold domain-containing protein n=1 Tax=Ammonifex degensii TaxID=42838 RepID=A0A7C2HUX5_9THEO